MSNIDNACKSELPLSQTVNDYASQCVKCALCLEHCPTYQLTLDENESPRGRIALFQAIAQAELPLTPKVKQHLDQCLGCRACEKVCPAKVKYGALLTKGRALLRQLSPALFTNEPLTLRFLRALVKKPRLQHLCHWLIWGTQKMGLRQLARALHLPKMLGVSNLETLLPTLSRPQKLKSHYPAIGKEQGKVKLFTGCLNGWCSQETLLASLTVLRHLGFSVSVPLKQTCCGAMALHAGLLEEAQQLAKQNTIAFASENTVSPIITVATGCQSVLQDYGVHFNPESIFASQVTDIMTFIEHCPWPNSLVPTPLPKKVIVHTPCTQRNTLKNPPSVSKILGQIPALSVESFSSPFCCGSAGTYMLEHPDFANPLVDKLLSELGDKKVDYLATTNIGCALHFKQALQKSSSAIKVVHPIVLIANSLGFKVQD